MWVWQWGDFTNDLMTIWVIIDPISAVPVFIALTSAFDQRTRRRVAFVASLVSLAVLFFFISLGQIIITAMGISIRAFEVAGGLILFLFAVDMVIGDRRRAADVEAVPETPLQLAIYPLAIPNLAGPGAMLTVILRTDNSRINLLEQIHTTAAVAAVLAIGFLLMLAATPITRVLGVGGANVIKRIMGMIIAAYAAHLVFSGIADWLHMEPL